MDVVAAHHQIATRSRWSAREGWILVGADLLVLAACFFLARFANIAVHGWGLAEGLMGWRFETGDERALMYMALAGAAVVAFWKHGHYARRRPFWQELGDVWATVAILLVIDAALTFLTRTNLSRLWLVSTWTLVGLLLPLARVALKKAMLRVGAWRRPTVVVGTGPNALDAAGALAGEPLLGFDVIAFLAPPGSAVPPGSYLTVEGRRLPVLAVGPGGSTLPAHLGKPHVVVALEMDEMSRCGRLVERLSLRCRDADIVSPVRGLPLVGTQVTHFISHDVLALRATYNLSNPLARRVKRCFDLTTASFLLIVTAPLFALIAWQVWLGGAGVIYGQRRIGKRGRPFTCYKFRTMVPGADRALAELLARDPAAREEWRQTRKLRRDPRVTAIGAWLRRTSLDELPQLWNVLRGEMSLVGPRPVVADELTEYGDSLPYYLEAKPGITGLWQISGRNDVDYRRRVHLDCWYVKNWTVWYDVVILLKTCRVVASRQGAY